MLGLLVQNSQLRYEVLHTWACNAQLIQMTRSCALVGYWFATLKFGFNLQPGNTVHNNPKIRYEIKHVCVCCTQLVNKFKSFAVFFGVHNCYKGYEVMHVGLMVHNPYKWYEYTHEWVGGAQFEKKGQCY